MSAARIGAMRSDAPMRSDADAVVPSASEALVIFIFAASVPHAHLREKALGGMAGGRGEGCA